MTQEGQQSNRPFQWCSASSEQYLLDLSECHVDTPNSPPMSLEDTNVEHLQRQDCNDVKSVNQVIEKVSGPAQDPKVGLLNYHNSPNSETNKTDTLPVITPIFYTYIWTYPLPVLSE